VFILKEVKVLCFDTLLQVLILKVVKVAVSVLLQPFASGDKSGLPQSHRVGGHPHPGCFGKRGCKLLKTKGGGWKKRAKRLQEIEGSRFRAGVEGAISEVCSR
jgi:hypothetical protein